MNQSAESWSSSCSIWAGGAFDRGASLSSAFLRRDKRSTMAYRVAPPTRGLELRRRVPRMGVNACTDIVVGVDSDG